LKPFLDSHFTGVNLQKCSALCPGSVPSWRVGVSAEVTDARTEVIALSGALPFPLYISGGVCFELVGIALTK
jgi:hypothetical protein